MLIPSGGQVFVGTNVTLEPLPGTPVMRASGGVYTGCCAGAPPPHAEANADDAVRTIFSVAGNRGAEPGFNVVGGRSRKGPGGGVNQSQLASARALHGVLVRGGGGKGAGVTGGGGARENHAPGWDSRSKRLGKWFGRSLRSSTRIYLLFSGQHAQRYQARDRGNAVVFRSARARQTAWGRCCFGLGGCESGPGIYGSC